MEVRGAMNEARVISQTPRELAPGVFWLGECGEIPFRGEVLHTGNSVYLVAGQECCAIVEGANSFQAGVVLDQIEGLIAQRGLPEVRYVFVTHSEVPHAGGVGHMLTRFPNAVACGGVGDLPLIFPQFADRIRFSEVGEHFDLGGSELRVVEAVFRDMPYTRWAFDTRRRVLFSGDGFSFSHLHDASQCRALAEEIPGLDIAGMMALFIVAAFHWVEYVDVEPFITRMDELVFEELRAELLAPTHGLPIGDPAATLPAIREGLRRGGRNVIEGLVQ